MPPFAPATPGERALRARIFNGTDLPVIQVELDGRWRIPGDGHPDARAAGAIADAIVNRLEQSGSVPHPQYISDDAKKHFLQSKH